MAYLGCPAAGPMQKSIYSDQQKHFCTLLKSARKSARLTQRALAERLGTHTSYISRYERGDRRLDLVEFLAIADALKIDPAELLKQVQV
jgi:transcriptional regulator with XRE-family HTH domain